MLIELTRQDGVNLTKAATSNGGEFAGACPACGGVDRFRVWPEEKGGRFWCRQCGKKGDAIQYLRDFRGMSFAEGFMRNRTRYSRRRCTA